MLIFRSFSTFAANLAGEFANFANSKHTPLGEETLTSRYNGHLFLLSCQLSQARSQQGTQPALVADLPALGEGLLTSTSQPTVGLIFFRQARSVSKGHFPRSAKVS